MEVVQFFIIAVHERQLDVVVLGHVGCGLSDTTASAVEADRRLVTIDNFNCGHIEF